MPRTRCLRAVGPRCRRRRRPPRAHWGHAPTNRRPAPRRAHRPPGRRPSDRRRAVREPAGRADRHAAHRAHAEPGPDAHASPRARTPHRPTPFPRDPDPTPEPAPAATPADPAPEGAPDATGRFIVMLRSNADTAAVVEKVSKRDGIKADRSFKKAFRGFSAKLDPSAEARPPRRPERRRPRPGRSRPPDRADRPDRHRARRRPHEHGRRDRWRRTTGSMPTSRSSTRASARTRT